MCASPTANKKTKRRFEGTLGGDILDAQGAARLLGAHVETIRRLARKAAVPSYKIGKDWRFSKEALDVWRATHRIPGQEALALVVDDEKSMRETMAAFLMGVGYRVAVAENGERAIAVARQGVPDVVLLDLVMPGMSGVEVLRQLHGMNPDLPVIIVTGHPDGELMAQALNYPPVTLLPKPVEKEVLLKTVRRTLRGVR